jgi:uncharacterized protein DUF6186
MTPSQAYAVYAALALAFVTCEVVARRGIGGRAVPTFADVMSMLRRSRAGKAVVLTGWLWLGWHLFVRAAPG